MMAKRISDLAHVVGDALGGRNVQPLLEVFQPLDQRGQVLTLTALVKAHEPFVSLAFTALAIRQFIRGKALRVGWCTRSLRCLCVELGGAEMVVVFLLVKPRQ